MVFLRPYASKRQIMASKSASSKIPKNLQSLKCALLLLEYTFILNRIATLYNFVIIVCSTVTIQ